MGLKAIFTSFFYISKLFLQSLSIMVKTKYMWRRAKATFQETLILQGVPKEAAEELANAYPNPMDDILTLTNVRKRRY
jgi:hypothetical protein